MAKVIFYCNSGANIHSTRKQTLDTDKDLNLDEGEWEQMSEDDRFLIVQEWANERLEIYWEYSDK